MNKVEAVVVALARVVGGFGRVDWDELANEAVDRVGDALFAVGSHHRANEGISRLLAQYIARGSSDSSSEDDYSQPRARYRATGNNEGDVDCQYVPRYLGMYLGRYDM